MRVRSRFSSLIACLSLIVATMTMAGCKETTFGGGGSAEPPSAPAKKTGDGDLTVSEETAQEVKFTGNNLTKEEQAINNCLDQWKGHPFDRDDVRNFRKISAAVTVLGVGKAINDTQVTDEPKLILVTAAVNVLGSPVYDLLNPRGFYCIMVGVNVKTDLTINAHCKAALADGQVSVNVLSDSEPSAAIGVDVLSKVTLNRVGKDCG